MQMLTPVPTFEKIACTIMAMMIDDDDHADPAGVMTNGDDLYCARPRSMSCCFPTTS